MMLAASVTAALFAQGRTETMLADGWQFSRDGQSWQEVSVPHDWAISGPFDKKWDMQTVAIVQNGETEASEKTGRSGALPWIGEGHYKRKITIPSVFNGRAELVFDGAMAEPTVKVNGLQAGYWAYGYNTFRVDITDFVKPGENTLEVNLQNKEESSRWYPGAGIYRPVTLITTGKTHLDDWSLVARTIEINDKKNTLMVEVDGKVMNVPPKTKPKVVTMAKVTMTTPDGKTVKSDDVPLAADGSFHTSFVFKNPKLWSPETPYLYKVITTIADSKGKVVDEKCIKTGIRTIRVTRENGFQLILRIAVIGDNVTQTVHVQGGIIVDNGDHIRNESRIFCENIAHFGFGINTRHCLQEIIAGQFVGEGFVNKIHGVFSF